MEMVLRPDSTFRPFSLTLSNGATVTGIYHIPKRSLTAPVYLPLVVGIHGGSCFASHFDIDSKHTASNASTALGVPFVAFNRPNYKGTSSTLPVAAKTTYLQEDGNWMHYFIFPALWESFGRPNSCTAIVLLCHSLGVPCAIVAAALHSRDKAPAYPLAGSIFSGYGPVSGYIQPHLPDVQEVNFPLDIKKVFMGADPDLDLCEESVYEQSAYQNTGMPIDEVEDLRNVQEGWYSYCESYTADITCPLQLTMSTNDGAWKATRAGMIEYAQVFSRSERVDTSLILGPPHAIEWSKWASGWYVRSFGWSIEVTTSYAWKITQIERTAGKKV